MRRPPLLLTSLLYLSACGSAKPDGGQGAPAAAEATPGDAQAKAEAKPGKSAGKEPGAPFCATIVPCFKALKFTGHFTAEVSVDINPDGSAASVSFAGEAPKPVQQCITQKIKAMTLKQYNGKPGRTRCKSSGQFSGGSQMVNNKHSYEVRAAADAKAGDAKAGDAKAG